MTVFRYDEDGLTRIRPWAGPSPLEPVAPAPDAGGNHPPPLYKSILKVVEAFAEASADLPARRAIITVSDGQDVYSESSRAKASKFIAENALAPDTRVALHVLGFAPGGDAAALTALGSLAVQTGGSYREIGAVDQASIASGLEAFAQGLKQSYVLTFDAKDVKCTGSAAARIEIGTESQEQAGAPGAICRRMPEGDAANTEEKAGETASPSSKSGCEGARAEALSLFALGFLAWRRRECFAADVSIRNVGAKR